MLNFIGSTIKLRITQVLEHKECSVKDLCAKHEINHRVLSEQLENSSVKLGFCLIYLICERFPDISTDWLLTGKGDMLKDVNATTSIPALEKRISELEYLIDLQRKLISLYESNEKTTNL